MSLLLHLRFMPNKGGFDFFHHTCFIFANEHEITNVRDKISVLLGGLFKQGRIIKGLLLLEEIKCGILDLVL